MFLGNNKGLFYSFYNSNGAGAGIFAHRFTRYTRSTRVKGKNDGRNPSGLFQKKAKTLFVAALAGAQIVFATGAFASDPSFKNPGGKWLPSQLAAHADTLRRLGIRIDPSELANIDQGILQAIVSLEFCSGSFVSPEGLIITNHHCVEGMLSYLTNEDKEKGIDSDYVANGFRARKRSEERSVGPSQKILITRKMENVTDEILNGVENEPDLIKRQKLIEARIKNLIAQRERPNEAIKIEVVPFYRGSKYVLIEQLELKDVRLVYAPPKGVGYYGGDTDNWHWPRHTGDFAIIRAYVQNGGKPRSYHENNVPYRPSRWLKINQGDAPVQAVSEQAGNGATEQRASRGLRTNDLVLVAGYPGSTNRLATAEEVRVQQEESMPKLVEDISDLIKLLKSLAKNDENIRKKTESTVFSLENSVKKNSEALKALKGIHFLDIKDREQKAFHEWLVSSMPSHANVLNEMEDLRKKYEDKGFDPSFARMIQFSSLLGSAVNVVRLAQAKTLPDEQREPAYQERKWVRLEQNERVKQKTLSLEVNTKVMALFLGKTIAWAHEKKKEVPSYVASFMTDGAIDESKVRSLFSESILQNEASRIEMLNKADASAIALSKDSLVKFAREVLVPQIEAREAASREQIGDYLPVLRRYVAALEAYAHSRGEEVAPDANSTLRVTYGLVRGYNRPSDGRYVAPFTHGRQLLEKHKINDAEFEIPVEIQRMIKRGDFRFLADETYGELPINFLADVDTTGGNSGSAALNANGELIGLLFDGNEDTLYSDHYFDGRVRSILLDIRYALAVIADSSSAHYLLGAEELNLPAVCELALQTKK